jgi:hypothetical protein
VKASSCNGCDLFCWAFDSLSFWLCLSDFMGFWISDQPAWRLEASRWC